jgi:hypothetical protein
VDPAALLGIREVLYIVDLEFPILLGESENDYMVVVELRAVDGLERGSGLY